MEQPAAFDQLFYPLDDHKGTTVMSLKSVLLTATMSLAPALALADGAAISVVDPYARSASPSAKSGAIFFELMNQGEDDRLIAASTPAANRAELHTHKEDANGVMKMLHVEEGFALPTGEALVLDRGGKHVMLMGLTAPLENGATVPLTLTFEKAGEITIDVIVDRDRKPAQGGHGDGHGHGDVHGHGDGHGDGHESGHTN